MIISRAVHIRDHLLHHFDWTGRARHHAGAQTREIEARKFRMSQLGDKHGRHAVDCRRPLRFDGGQHGLRVESVIRQNQRAPARQRRHGADHVAEAVREGHRQTDAVAFGVAQHARAQEAVVDQIAVA